MGPLHSQISVQSILLKIHFWSQLDIFHFQPHLQQIHMPMQLDDISKESEDSELVRIYFHSQSKQ